MAPPSPTADREAMQAIRALVSERRYEEAWEQLRRLLLSGDDAATWNVARSVLRDGERGGWSPPWNRELRLAVLCTYEAAELREHLDLACRALGIRAVLYAAPYGQMEQEVLDADSGLARFAPTHVLIAPTTADLGFEELVDDAEGVLQAEEHRWRTLWETLAGRLRARVVQHAFVVPDETPLGHLALRLPGSRPSLVRELNARLGAAAGSNVLLVDCDRLASRLGKGRWCDPRLWYVARQPYSYSALPLLARETAAVLAGELGLGARCLVVDLDNTLWGGIVAEEGADGIVVGEGPDGEAYAAFQEYLRALKERGVVLAVASKNDADTAREPFELNPKMRLGLADFAVFVADWRRKPEQVAEIAERLGLGFDALVFVDDNPAECSEVAAALPAVDTISLDGSPSEFIRTLASTIRFETPSLTVEDTGRQRSYLARAQADELRATTTSLEDFWRSLDMRARVSSLEASAVERAAQLTQKTNQFNLTLNRRSPEEIEQLKDDSSAVCRTLEFEDRFASHGLVGLAFAVPDATDPETAVIDTLLLSCRVIGRTAEHHLLSHLGRAALDVGFVRLRGIYVPGPRNALVADLYPRLGFVPSPTRNGDRWDYDLVANGPLESVYITDFE
jgi:FkbH-like protein